MKFTVRDPGATTTVEVADGRVSWQTETAVRDHLLRMLHERGTNTGRAPLGDSHGAWQKCAEIPAALLFQKIPPEAWGDEAALARLLNEPEFRAFRCDGGRTF